MPSQPHLQVFNPDRSAQDGEPHFHLFNQLPTEVRLKIWGRALEKQRIINVQLSGPPEQWETGIEDGVDSSGDSGRYCAYVDGYQLMSKFLRVTSESREVALKFYRVRLPCRLTIEPNDTEEIFREETKPGTLYFNPEYDFLHISIRLIPPRLPTMKNDYLLDFLLDLKTTYDPRHVGLLNLAVDTNDLLHFEWSDFDFRGKHAFLDTIKQLQEVFFLFRQRYGRTNFGLATGVDTNEFFFARSVPIMPLTPSFERLQRDPRPIAQDLKKLHLGTTDPREGPAAWGRLLRQWGVSPAGTEYKYLLAFVNPGGKHAICNRESATRWLKTEDEDCWRSPGMRKYKFNWPDEDLERAVNSAFGFWLFPLDAFGPFQENGEPHDQGRLRSLRDLSGHWPGLALSSLP